MKNLSSNSVNNRSLRIRNESIIENNNEVNKSLNNTMSTSTKSKLQQQQQHQHHTRNALNKSRHRIKPAELYRTDFITAMKLPDNEVLDDDSYWLIKDPWKLDWEKGVQVPIKPNELNTANCKLFKIESNQLNVVNKPLTFKLPKKYLCPVNDPNFDVNIHEAYITHRVVDEICRYDSDEFDVCWLNRINLEFQLMGIEQLNRLNFERLIENFETQTHENLKEAIKTLESYSIEYDEEVVCDVCRSPDSEDTNEMVFCDGCNLCVHQACYGIDKIPKGSWLCAPCQLSLKPQCILCPNSGGAMKATRNLRNWCHVSCALWIPEVGFGNPDKMEPIVNINKIPTARWQLLCHLCKEKRGCCFQCSEKKCHSAFHITCAFKHNLEMQTILGHKDDDIVFKAYCLKHSRKRQTYIQKQQKQQQQQQQQQQHSPINTLSTITNNMNTTENTSTIVANLNNSPSSTTSLNNDLCKLNEQERKKETEKRIQKLDIEFYKYASQELAFEALKINRLHIDYVFNYWKLKRRYKLNKPLLIPKADEDLMNQSERLLNARIKMFIHLRQDLERVRNLCYMVIKREKLKKKLFQIKTGLFYKQCDFINKYGVERSGRTKDILSTKHGNCVYDYLNNYLENVNNNKLLINAKKLDFQKELEQLENHDRKNNELVRSLSATSISTTSTAPINTIDTDKSSLTTVFASNFKNEQFESNDEQHQQQECDVENDEHESGVMNLSNESIKNENLLKTSLRSTTNLLNNNKKKILTNRIKIKYKNIHHLSSSNSTSHATNDKTLTKGSPSKTRTSISPNKNGFNTSKLNANDTLSLFNKQSKEGVNSNQYKRRSTSDYETLKLLNNDLKFTRSANTTPISNGFLKCANNKKLKLTPKSANHHYQQKSSKMRSSLRNSLTTTRITSPSTKLHSSVSSSTIDASTSPSKNKTSSTARELNFNQNRHARLSYENDSF